MEPVYEGEPILAVAAIDELTAAEAIEKIVIEFEPLPFNVDPGRRPQAGQSECAAAGQHVDASRGAAGSAAAVRCAAGAPQARLRRRGRRRRCRRRSGAGCGSPRRAPLVRRRIAAAGAAAGAAHARAAGHAGRRHAAATAGCRRRGAAAAAAGGGAGRQVPAVARPRWPRAAAGRPAATADHRAQWTDEDFAAAKDGQLPMGKPTDEWTFGDVDAVMQDRPISCSTKRSSRSPPAISRSKRARRWRTGRTASCSCTARRRARCRRLRRSRAASAFRRQKRKTRSCSSASTRAAASAARFRAPTTWRSRRCWRRRPTRRCMLRISREEEHYIGRARPGVHARVKIGFRKDGKILAIDGFALGENGPYDSQGDCRSAGRTISLCYQPTAMRWRSHERADQHAAESVAARAGRHAGQRPLRADAHQGRAISSASIRCEIRKINAPAGKAKFGPARRRATSRRT